MSYRKSRALLQAPLVGVAQTQLDFSDPLANQLFAWWPFNDSNAQAVANNVKAVGSGGQLTLANGPVFTAGGPRGTALVFDGTNDYATIASINLSAFNKMTVAFWAKFTSIGDNIIFETSVNAGAAAGNFFIALNNSSFAGTVEVLCISSAGTPSTHISDQTFPQASVGKWHHYVVGFDLTVSGAGKIAFATVDGVQQVLTSRVATDTTTGGVFSSSTPFYVMSRAGSSLFVNGSMQDLRLYTRLLPVSEAASIFQEPWRPFAPDRFRIGRAPATAGTTGRFFLIQPMLPFA